MAKKKGPGSTNGSEDGESSIKLVRAHLREEDEKAKRLPRVTDEKEAKVTGKAVRSPGKGMHN